jgi:hypothetical protein
MPLAWPLQGVSSCIRKVCQVAVTPRRMSAFKLCAAPASIVSLASHFQVEPSPLVDSTVGGASAVHSWPKAVALPLVQAHNNSKKHVDRVLWLAGHATAASQPQPLPPTQPPRPASQPRRPGNRKCSRGSRRRRWSCRSSSSSIHSSSHSSSSSSSSQLVQSHPRRRRRWRGVTSPTTLIAR